MISDKVMLMCLVHVLGEAITGDIPAFNKSNKDEEIEKEAVNKVIEVLDRELGEEGEKNLKIYLLKYMKKKQKNGNYLRLWIILK